VPLHAVDKPLGLTSHDVVARARRLLGTRRVGHAGTLDPLATGVLLVMSEESTKLSPYLTGHDKTYLAWVTFGAATPTLDAEGPVVSVADASGVTAARLAAERQAALAAEATLHQQRARDQARQRAEEAAQRAATAPSIRAFPAGLLAEDAQRLGVVYQQQAALPARHRQVIAKRSVAAAGAAQPIGDDNRTAGGGAAKQPLERGGVMVAEGRHRRTLCGRPFHAPAGDRVGAAIHVEAVSLIG